MRTVLITGLASAAIVGLTIIGAAPASAAATGHRVVTCKMVHVSAKHDKGRICIFAYLNPNIQERHYRAEVSFTSLKGGSLTRVHGSRIYVTLDGKRYAVKRNPNKSASGHAKKLWLMSGWAAHGEPSNILAIIDAPCMTWHNGGRACLKGSLSGGPAGNASAVS